MHLADRLRQARRRRFVGRQGECELFRSAIAAQELPFCVLWIHGPGGVGKTTLLREFASLATGAGIQVLYLDAKYFDPTLEAFGAALAQALGEEGRDAFLNRLATSGERLVLLIDTYEELNALDRWLRNTFLPQLPGDALTVLAGRNAPGREWRTDAGWQSLLKIVSLRNFNREESRTYLAAQQVPAARHRSVLEFTHGHPLALSLVADVYAQGHTGEFAAENEPDVIKVLIECFVAELPSLLHRQALEACVLVHITTEALLSELLAVADPYPYFEWLRGLSFIESTQTGLFPHELAREVLSADLRWRNRDRYIELHSRARRYYHTRLQQDSGERQQEMLFDYIYLHRDNPLVKPLFEWQHPTHIAIEPVQPDDRPHLLAMVEQYEGIASAALAAHWLDCQPQSVLVYRDSAAQPLGFLMSLALHTATEAERNLDPATERAWRYLQSHAPLRPGEGATYFRFWMTREHYHSPSPVQSLLLTSIVRHYLTTAGLAFSFFPVRNPEMWAKMSAYADLIRIAEVDFTVGGITYGIYGHDWRLTPPAAWLSLLAEREVAMSAAVQPSAPPTRTPVLVLSAEDFTAAVRQALRDFARPDLLQQNPLVRSRLVSDRLAAEPGSEPAALLQKQILEAAALLRDSPRDRKAYLALDRTYLQPADSQEQAAEVLDMPFSTYRRHLTAAVARVREILWQRELQGLS
ncbi:AAA family ATPase [Gloeobacter kilaueensis]|uniref:Recombination factor protein RarA n=1 Tax=Gloeobacter kilaueensis (strain ATCC BAA-2537 / CCAP 1431/1 / ULC 316 / JS1) TaxID=1183438 RepID=U5QIH6_GLOK1|nr:AAA family ATPase [Gloeobacter kilaueensis]AGY57399.1 recombination factor protein RarA [Gloeobacter kilaueensis JS1]